jgi:hypothetical protein
MKEYTITFELFGVTKKVRVNARNEIEAKEKVNCFIINKVCYLNCESKKTECTNKEVDKLFQIFDSFNK